MAMMPGRSQISRLGERSVGGHKPTSCWTSTGPRATSENALMSTCGARQQSHQVLPESYPFLTVTFSCLHPSVLPHPHYHGDFPGMGLDDVGWGWMMPQLITITPIRGRIYMSFPFSYLSPPLAIPFPTKPGVLWFLEFLG